uniref:ISXO2-like transposase domain-containing protein n=1 Tax=Acrobeloides nanus TaxID=290746 RepID=A0A914DEN7_9BILA
MIGFAHMWARGYLLKDIMHELNIVSWATACDWSSFCREICLIAYIEYPKKLGGVGKHVEIDESKDKNTLIPLINKWIIDGTTILSDCWKAYNSLEEEGFVHLKKSARCSNSDYTIEFFKLAGMVYCQTAEKDVNNELEELELDDLGLFDGEEE